MALPAFCFSRIMAATDSLSRCISLPVLVFLLFCVAGKQGAGVSKAVPRVGFLFFIPHSGGKAGSRRPGGLGWAPLQTGPLGGYGVTKVGPGDVRPQRG